MRKQFVKTIEEMMALDPRIIMLLGDIGVFGFRNSFKLYSDRTYNIGICEQAMAGIAAGLAREGLLPVLHSIAPFVVERSFEQLKIDLGYQDLPVRIVSVGASYDYAALGCTHHCPGDVAVLKAIPGMQIVIPGTPCEFDAIFRESYTSKHPTYFRLSERNHGERLAVRFGKAFVVQRGNLGTVVAIGPNLSAVLEASRGLDVSILYYSTVAPFDADTLLKNSAQGAIAVVEPFYEGTMAADIMAALNGKPVRFLSIGVPRRFLANYGKAEEHDEKNGLSATQLRTRIESFFYAKV